MAKGLKEGVVVKNAGTLPRKVGQGMRKPMQEKRITDHVRHRRIVGEVDEARGGWGVETVAHGKHWGQPCHCRAW